MTTPLSAQGRRLGELKDVAAWQSGLAGVEKCLAVVTKIPHGTASTDYAFKIGSLQTYNGTTTRRDLYAPNTLIPGFTGTAYYYITRAIVNNPSADLSLATSSLYTAASAGGTAIISDAALTTLNAATATLNATRTIAAGGTGNLFTSAANGTLYYRVGTNVTGNADFYLFGFLLP